MGILQKWFEHGFEVEHTPGVARSLLRVESCGAQFILTDLEGFDLPCECGPFQIMRVSNDGQTTSGPEVFEDVDGVVAWIASRSASASGQS